MNLVRLVAANGFLFQRCGLQIFAYAYYAFRTSIRVVAISFSITYMLFLARLNAHFAVFAEIDIGFAECMVLVLQKYENPKCVGLSVLSAALARNPIVKK